MNRYTQYLSIALTLVLSACASQTAEVQEAEYDGELNNVTAIQVAEEEGESLLRIISSKELKYNVFKLTDPERIMVDLIDARLAEGVAADAESSAVVEAVNLQAIEDSLSTLVRVEVELAQSANYLAGIEEGALVIRLLPEGQDFESPNAQDEVDVFADLPGLPEDEDGLELPEVEEEPVESLDGATALTDEESEMAEEPMEMESESLAEAPEAEAVPEPEALPLPSLDMPEGEGMEVAGESMDEPSVEAPTEELAEAEPLPVPAPIPAPDATEGEQPMEDGQAMAEAETESAEPLVEPEPLPLVEEDVEAEEMPEESEELAEEEVVVEPEAEELAEIETQDIPTSTFTDGTSLIGGMSNRVYTGKRISLEFQDAEVTDVLRLIADVSKLNLIVSDDVTGKVTLKLVDVPWDQALDIILTSKGLDKVQSGNILRIAPIEALKKEREIALANDKAAKQLEPLRLKLFNINYADASEMASRIENLLSERGSTDVDERTNTLIVEDISENLSRVDNLINVLDTQTPQVRIESRIVQANDSFTRNIGVQWGPTLRMDESNGKDTSLSFPRTINIGTSPQDAGGSATAPAFTAPPAVALSNFAVDALPGGEVQGGALGFRLGSVSDIFNLDLRLQYAELQNAAKVVSRPSVTVLDNRSAKIIQGTKIPFLSSSSEGSNVQFQDAGIEISVTPQITNDGSVILQVDTKSNEPGGEVVGGNPIINIREANTEVLVKSGRTAVLGGVFKTSETQGSGGVPGLMDLPVLGWLFKGDSGSSTREETLIFITPHILTDAREAVAGPSSLSDLEP